MTRLNALVEFHIECTLGWISEHRPYVVGCFAQVICPAMQLISATSIAETFVQPDFTSVVGSTCALHHTRELIVMKHCQKRVAMQANAHKLLWVVFRLAGVFCKVGQLFRGGCWAFGIGALDDICHVRVCQDVHGRVGTHTNSSRNTLQILMAKTLALEKAVDSWPGAACKGFGRAGQCSVAQFILAIEAIQGSLSAPGNDAAVGILICRARLHTFQFLALLCIGHQIRNLLATFTHKVGTTFDSLQACRISQAIPDFRPTWPESGTDAVGHVGAVSIGDESRHLAATLIHETLSNIKHGGIAGEDKDLVACIVHRICLSLGVTLLSASSRAEAMENH